MPTAYQNFDLIIAAAGDGYSARVIASPAGEFSTDAPFSAPFTPDELTSFFRGRGRMRGLRPVDEETMAETELGPRQFGARLYEAVFGDGVGDLLLRSIDAVERAGEGLRIRLRLDASELADLPWEYLYLPARGRFLANSTETVLLRYIEQSRPVTPLAVTGALTVLAVVANPGGDWLELDVEREWAQLQRALAPLAETVTLARLEAPTLAALQARLRQGPVHVLHFIGHGFFERETNSGGLVLEDGAGGAVRVTADRLATLLHDHDPLRLIFLNACEGARSGQTDPFGGVAQTLVRQGIPAVLAMQFAVSDDAAITLGSEFYRSLADAYPVDAAVSEARKAVYIGGNDFEWGTPVLFSRAADNALFVPTQEEQDAPAAGPPSQTSVDTGGGAYIGGNVSVGGNFVGRDQIRNGPRNQDE